jgi:hypothetical protein
MQIDATLLLAIGGIITGIFAFISSRSVDKRAARRDEVSLLRDEVARLQTRVDQLTSANENWRTKYDNLYSYVLMLRKILVDHNIDVPEMSAFDDNSIHADATSHPEKRAKEKKIEL